MIEQLKYIYIIDKNIEIELTLDEKFFLDPILTYPMNTNNRQQIISTIARLAIK
jgi:hypothetical protein